VSEATTQGVHVAVQSRFLPDHSDPASGLWMHAYQVTISNVGERPVQLLSRHWIITNSHGVQEHVRGAGVVGEQPSLKPGESFRYTSGCPLDTAMGTMHGTYTMRQLDTGETFEAEVAPFTLAEPYALN
jgi:ApaG protein